MNLLVVDDEYYIVQGIISSIRCDVLGIDSIFAAYSCEQARQIIAKKTGGYSNYRHRNVT